jgi:hypothetical protein
MGTMRLDYELKEMNLEKVWMLFLLLLIRNLSSRTLWHNFQIIKNTSEKINKNYCHMLQLAYYII